MKFYTIIILTKQQLEINNPNYLLINDTSLLVDQTTLKTNNDIYSFDYLIFDDTSLINNLSNSNILLDNNIPVTNFYKVTSLENILYTNDILDSLANIENNEI